MRKPNVIAAFSLLFLSSTYARAQKGITVPLEILRTGHAAVKVTINGKGPFRLALDTGSPVTFVSAQCAVKIGILSKEEAEKQTLFRMPTAVRTIEIGAAKLKDLSVMIIDHPTVQMIGQVEGQIDGIVGFSFFSHFRMTLDYAGKKITLEPIDYQGEDVMASLMNRFMSDQSAKRIITSGGLWGVRFGERQGDIGISVKSVYAGGAAASAGIKAGDIVVSIDGRWTLTPVDFAEAAIYAKPGQPANVKLQRNGSPLELKVVPRLGF
jgi:hypothetical protein